MFILLSRVMPLGKVPGKLCITHLKQKSVYGSRFSTEVLRMKRFVDSHTEDTKNHGKAIRKCSSDSKAKTENDDYHESSIEEESNEKEVKNASSKKGETETRNDSSKGNRNSNADDGKKLSKEIKKEIGLLALKTAALSGIILGGTALIVPAIGFGPAGVTEGSLAALYQSTFLGGTIASGSAFATLQSIGAAGLSAAANTAVVAGSAAVSGAHSIIKNKKNDEK